MDMKRSPPKRSTSGTYASASTAPAPLWMSTVSTDEADFEQTSPYSRSTPTLKLQRSFSSVSNNSNTGYSMCSEGTFKSKYEPLRSIHADIQDVFLRPTRKLYSRGHEIPEPSYHSPSGAGSVGGRAISRGSQRFDTTSRNNANVQARPHTSGTALPGCFSPIRPTERSKQLFSRASSPLMLRHGHVISQDIFGKHYPYPLNNVSYERPSIVCHDIKNSAMPDGADSILEDSRFSSIAPFIKKEFYDSMTTSQMKELAEKRKKKKIVTKAFPNVPPMMTIDYEKRGTAGATKRQVHRQLFA
mmetsp:Transcript_26911/g.45425  ORF Transcript_26911/g.45425 Transcript_26911/m.45425 type:complete len:301 (-) Transcript_26911:274-1176(-)